MTSENARKLYGLIERSTPDDIKIALAYTTLLKLNHAHPFRIAQQKTLAACRDYLALIYSRDPEWVQGAFEERARELS